MKKQYYISTHNITDSIDEILKKGTGITVGGVYYEGLIAKPRGRRILKRLKSLEGDLQFIIYA